MSTGVLTLVYGKISKSNLPRKKNSKKITKHIDTIVFL